MSAFNGTPGPWLRIDTADYAEIHSAFRPSSQAVALVGKPDDANLIAASPDLLEALRKFAAIEIWLDGPHVTENMPNGYSDPQLWREHVFAARKAIAAATGEGLS